MKTDLIKPCSECPFRCDIRAYLTRGRAREIIRGITEKDGTFSCHKTTTSKGRSDRHHDAQHCAGAMIMLEKLESPNQWMRIAERLGFYDRRKLDMTAPVYLNPAAFIQAQER